MWQLVKCKYDYMGMYHNEIENPEKFTDTSTENVSYCIGTVIDHAGRKLLRVELEGRTESLNEVIRMTAENSKLKEKIQSVIDLINNEGEVSKWKIQNRLFEALKGE